jgi:WD40 repeat protein
VSATSGEVVWRSDEYVDMTWTSDPHQIVGWTPSGIGHVLDVRTGRPVQRLQNILGDLPNGVLLAAGGRHLLAWVLGGFGGAVVAVWDLSTGKGVAARQVPDGTHGSLTEDGRIVVWVHDGGASTYDMSLEDGDEEADSRTLATRQGLVTAAVSSSGLVAASRTDGRLGFYDARTLKPRGPPLAGTPGQVEQLSFSRDGDLLAVRGATGALRLIDTRSRIQLGEPIELGLDRTRRVALRADGHELTVATDDGIRMWDLRPGHWTREACGLVERDLTREEWATYLAPVGAYRSTCR